MKLKVEGIEEIEITDPAGLCDPPAPMPAMLPSPVPRGIPQLPPGTNPFRPQPGAPTPFGDPALPGIRPLPGIGPYTRVPEPNDPFNKTKWGVGGDAIQRAGDILGKESKNTGAEGQEDGNGNSHKTG